MANKAKLKELARYYVFQKEFYSQHVSGPDYDLVVSTSLPVFGEVLGGMRYNTGGELFLGGGKYPSASDAGREATSLNLGMTRKYCGDLIPRRWLVDHGHLTDEQSRKADFLGAKMVVRDKNPARAAEIRNRKDEYNPEVQDFFQRAGQFVDNISATNPSDIHGPRLERFYNTAPDSNTSAVKMTYVRRGTEKVHCLPQGEPYYGSGDPSIVTAMGLVGAIKAIREEHFPGEDSIQVGLSGGAGSVGGYAIQFLRELEASGRLGFKVDLKASDVDVKEKQTRLKELRSRYGFEIVEPGTEHRDVHVWSPNALIGSFTYDRARELRNRTAVVGAENEQLPENPFDRDDPVIRREVQRIYAFLKEIEGYNSPDFVNNNGGIHDVNCRVMFGKEGYTKQTAIDTMLLAGQEYVRAVYRHVQEIQESDRRRSVQSHVIAQEMALDAFVDRLIERREYVLKGPFAAYFADAL